MGRVVPFLPPAASGPEPVSPDHPTCHVPSVAGAVEAFFAGRDLAAASCRTYRQALGPLVEAVGGDRPNSPADLPAPWWATPKPIAELLLTEIGGFDWSAWLVFLEAEGEPVKIVGLQSHAWSP